MKRPFFLVNKFSIILLIITAPNLGRAQQNDSLEIITRAGLTPGDTFPQKNLLPAQTQETPYRLTFHNYLSLLGEDIKIQARAPFRLNGKEWLKVGGFGLLTAGIMLHDEKINQGAKNVVKNSGFVRSVSPWVTKFGAKYEFYALGALGASGLIFKDEKLKTTTLLATQAYITSELWVALIKFVSGRQRPCYYPATGENESAWHGAFYQFGKTNQGGRPDGNSFTSFASGHSTAAFAVATVFAEQYRDKPIIPIISYSAATLVGLSRLTENKHWASDVFVGAALGYFSGRQVVRNYRKRQSENSLIQKKKNTMVFDIKYNHGVIMPGLTYTFR